jgi:3'(2'), 5'-bisphosphate nucleotidase
MTKHQGGRNSGEFRHPPRRQETQNCQGSLGLTLHASRFTLHAPRSTLHAPVPYHQGRADAAESLVFRDRSYHILRDPNPMQYARELAVTLEAAAVADRLIMEHYQNLVVIPDAPANISTDTDRQSQETILRHLHAAFPADALLAEENTPTADAVPKSGSRLWIVDPIDGTRGFARKNGEFSVMIAFVEEGKVVVGVVTEPAKDRRTYASLGSGCWKQDGSAPPVRCRVTTVAKLAEATVTQSHTKPGAPPGKELRALSPKRVIETYSAGVKLAQVARGEAEIYLNTYDACHDWDIAAGHLLVDEAGGKVTNLLGQAPRYGLPGAWQPHGLVASNGKLQAAALAELAGVR